jgi:hypothetical protein
MDGPRVLAPAGAGPSSGMGVSCPGFGFSNVVVSGCAGGPTCFAAGGGCGRDAARLGGTFSRAFGGVMGSTGVGVRGAAVRIGGGFAGTTSVFVRIVGGVSGSTSDVATGSGGAGGGGAMTTSAGMRSDRDGTRCNAPQRDDSANIAVAWTTSEVRKAGARGRGKDLMVAPSAQA